MHHPSTASTIHVRSQLVRCLCMLRPLALRLLVRCSVVLSLVVLGLVVLAGCTKQFIPNTDVEDTEDNRRVVAFCESYRKAVERRDVGKILSMVSVTYFEDGGNVDPSDDMDYEGLREYLLGPFGESKAIRYEIRYRRILWSKESERVFVDYTYSASFKIPGTEDKDEWRRVVAENRLELKTDGDSFRILSGL